MGTKFVLTSNLWGWTYSTPSTYEAYQQAQSANQHLLMCLAVEEAFAIMISNYISFEKAVIGASIENMAVRSPSRSVFDNRRREIDRHLVNLLATGEMFTEHVRRRIKKGYGRASPQVEIVDAALGSQRGRLAGFWATEYLRNAVLHNSLPVTSWTMSSRWVGLEGSDGVFDKRNPSARHEHSVTFAFDPDLLAEDRKISRDLITQLKARADKHGKVSWVPIIREYVEALSLVLKEVRTALEPSEQDATDLLRSLVDEFRVALPDGIDQPHYVLLVERNDDGDWLDEVTLNLGLEDQIQELRQQHGPMVNLHRSGIRDSAT